MLKALLVKGSGYIDVTEEELKNKINPQNIRVWSNDFDEAELRIDLADLTEKEKRTIRDYLNLDEFDIRHSNYLIIWF